jgi:hypothetical protein
MRGIPSLPVMENRMKKYPQAIGFAATFLAGGGTLRL